MSRRVDRAAELRAARELFQLSQELNCLPKDAVRELRRRRLAALDACGRTFVDRPTDPAAEQASPASSLTDWDAPWMMRN